jgi:hypothetical protein
MSLRDAGSSVHEWLRSVWVGCLLGRAKKEDDVNENRKLAIAREFIDRYGMVVRMVPGIIGLAVSESGKADDYELRICHCSDDPAIEQQIREAIDELEDYGREVIVERVH